MPDWVSVSNMQHSFAICSQPEIIHFQHTSSSFKPFGKICIEIINDRRHAYLKVFMGAIWNHPIVVHLQHADIPNAPSCYPRQIEPKYINCTFCFWGSAIRQSYVTHVGYAIAGCSFQCDVFDARKTFTDWQMDLGFQSHLFMSTRNSVASTHLNKQ